MDEGMGARSDMHPHVTQVTAVHRAICQGNRTGRLGKTVAHGEHALGHVALSGAVVGELGERPSILFQSTVPLVSPGVLMGTLHRRVVDCFVSCHSFPSGLSTENKNNKPAGHTSAVRPI